MTSSKAPLVGTGGGAAIGFLFGGPIGAAIGAGIGYLGGKRFTVSHGMNADRKKIYEEALKSMADPLSLRKLADGFEKEGLHEEAELLRKRAALRELPLDQKTARKEAFRKYISVGTTENPATPEKISVIEKAAEVFHSQGATGNAARLRAHAAGLKKLLASKA